MGNRLRVVVFTLFVLCGCAATKASMSNYEACKNDAACLAKMQKAGNYTSSIVEAIATPVIPFAGGVALFFGGLATVLTGVFLGAKIKK